VERSALQCVVAVCCSVLQGSFANECVAVSCSVAVCCSVWNAVHCSVLLQCVAVCCRVLLRMSVLQ